MALGGLGHTLVGAGIGGVAGGGLGSINYFDPNNPWSGRQPANKAEQKRNQKKNALIGGISGAVSGAVAGGILGHQMGEAVSEAGRRRWEETYKAWSEDFRRRARETYGGWGGKAPRAGQNVGQSAAEAAANKWGMPKAPANAAERKKAYKASAFKWHPDKAKPEDRARAEEAMKDINDWNSFWQAKVGMWHAFYDELSLIKAAIR